MIFRQSGIGYPIITIIISLVLWLWPREKCLAEFKAQITDTISVNYNLTSKKLINTMDKTDYLAIPRVLFAIFLMITMLFFLLKKIQQILFTSYRLSELRRLKIE